MANFAVATQILIDGPRNTVSKVTGDLTTALATGPTVIIDPALLTDMLPGMAGPHLASLLRIDYIDYSITDGLGIILTWVASAPVAIVELYGRGRLEAKQFGGYQNNAGAGVTGQIALTTFATGAATPTDASLLLVIHTVKYRPITLGGA
jgi:hypothetical protein